MKEFFKATKFKVIFTIVYLVISYALDRWNTWAFADFKRFTSGILGWPIDYLRLVVVKLLLFAAPQLRYSQNPMDILWVTIPTLILFIAYIYLLSCLCEYVFLRKIRINITKRT